MPKISSVATPRLSYFQLQLLLFYNRMSFVRSLFRKNSLRITQETARVRNRTKLLLIQNNRRVIGDILEYKRSSGSRKAWKGRNDYLETAQSHEGQSFRATVDKARHINTDHQLIRAAVNVELQGSPH